MTLTQPSPGPSVAFGARATEHSLVQWHRDGAWSAPRIESTERLELAPHARVLHYGQSVFEGLKARRLVDGRVALFRPQAHLERLVRSCKRMALPAPDPVRLLESIRELVALDAREVPEAPASLYVRPVVYAADEDLVAGPAAEAVLRVTLAPVGAYLTDSDGLRLRTELEQVRAFPGGTGAIKCAGNYAAAMLAQRQAREDGYHEVVWLDALEHRYLEETGAMNLFLVRNGGLVTAPAGDTVLPGVTRDSLLHLAADRGLPTLEARVPARVEAFRDVTEVFSSGTAVGCLPVAEIDHLGRPLFRRSGSGPVQTELAEALRALQEGRSRDPRGWRVPC